MDKKQQIIEAFKNRSATKEFDDTKKISDEDFHFILEAGRLSPSSFGFEPWKFLVIENKALKEKIRTIAWGAQGQALTASHFVIILARTKKDMSYDSEYIRYIARDIQQTAEENMELRMERFKSFQLEDFKLFEGERALEDWVKRQTYIPLANMMSVAAQIGIDSCPIEGFHQQSLHDILESEGLLEEGSFIPSVMVTFGYRIREGRPKTRRSLNEVVKWVK